MSRDEGRKVTGEDLARAERLISQLYGKIHGANPVDVVCQKAKLDREGTDAFIRHHMTLLTKKYLPDIDPRHEPALNTMFLHMLAVGATAQRVSEGRS